MEHSPVMKCLKMGTWLLSSLVCINMLTGMYDYNAIIWIGNMMPAVIEPLMWVIGLAGIFSLAMFIKVVMMGCPMCGACPCKCGSNRCE